MIFNLFGLFGLHGIPNVRVAADEVEYVTRQKIREMMHESQDIIDGFVVSHILKCAGLMRLQLEGADKKELLSWLKKNLTDAGVPELVTMTPDDIYGSSDPKILELKAQMGSIIAPGRSSEEIARDLKGFDASLTDKEKKAVHELPKAYKYIEPKAPYNLDNRAVRNLIFFSSCIAFMSQRKIDDLDFFEKLVFAVVE